MHIFPNISGSKVKRAMKLGQFIDYNMRNTFLRKLCRKWGKETSSRPPFKVWRESKWSATSFQYILIALNLGYNKNKLHKTLDY